MRQVSKEQFYAAMGPLNVHPCPEERDRTIWRLQDGGGRRIVGISKPGYASPLGTPEEYMLDIPSKED